MRKSIRLLSLVSVKSATFVEYKITRKMKTINTRRTIRKYATREVDNELLHRLLAEAERTQTMGNLQFYSVVVTRDDEMKRRLAPAHFASRW